MTKRLGFLVLLAFGVVITRVASADRLVAYVRPASRPYVLAAGLLVTAFGICLWLTPVRIATPPPSVGWLLLVPIVALVGVAPPTDGALTGHRRQGAPARPADTTVALRGTEPIPMPLAEVVQRASWAIGSLRGHRLRVLGFVAGRHGRAVVLGRLSITCCAADAQEDDVEVRGPPVTSTAYALGEWLLVTATFTELSPENRFEPVLSAATVEAVEAPRNPYD
jgi:uncharacterized repeat protein (TIGR03943 family)